MAKQEIITFANALKRMNLGTLASDMHRSSFVSWEGQPVPFSCGHYKVAKDTAGVSQTIRVAQSHVGEGCVLYSWSLMTSNGRGGDWYKIGEAWVAVAKSSDSCDMYLVAGLS